MSHEAIRDYDDLIQREIDGDLSASETSTLIAIVANDAEAREFRDDLRGLGQALDRMADHDVPAELKVDVMAEVALTPVVQPGPTHPRPQRVSRRREALAFAAGIAIVLIGGRMVPLLESTVVDERQAAGALMSSQPELLEPSLADTGSLSTDRFELSARTERRAGRLFLSLEGNCDGGLPVSVRYDDADWAVVGLDRGDASSSSEMSLAPGNLSFVQAEPGAFRLEMEFQSRSSSTAAGSIALHVGAGSQVESIELRTVAGPAGRTPMNR